MDKSIDKNDVTVRDKVLGLYRGVSLIHWMYPFAIERLRLYNIMQVD